MLLEMYVQATTWLRDRFDHMSDEGATAVEYGLIVALIAAVIVVIVGALGGQVKGGFQKVCDALKNGTC